MSAMTILHIVTLLLITVTNIILAFVGGTGVKIILGIGVVILIIVLITRTSGLVRISYSSFFILSIILTSLYDIPIKNALDALISHSIFVALFVCIPLIKIPLQLGNYMDELIPLMKSAPRQFINPMIVALNFVLSSFLNLGGIRIVNQFFNNTMRNYAKIYGMILSRSFSLVALWTPYSAAFTVAVSYSGGNSAFVICIGLLLGFLTLFMWTLPWLLNVRKIGFDAPFRKKDRRNLINLISFFVLLVGSVALLSYLTNLGVIVIISLLSIFYSVIWSIKLKKMKGFIKELRSLVVNELPLVREEAFLFISIGFFANTLLELGWKLHLPNLSLYSPLHVFFFIVIFGLIVIIIASFGIHHLVTITLVTTGLEWHQLGIEPVIYAMTILLAWSISSMISPFSPTNLIAGRITNQTPFQIGILSNGLFGFFVLVGGAFYLTIVNSLLV